MYGSKLRCQVCNLYKPDRCKCIFKSVALWPESVSTGKVPNESDDSHTSLEAAVHVCQVLRREGLGGNRVIFPIQVYVLLPDGKKMSV